MAAPERGEADDVDVFLDGGGDDHLGRLPQAGIDHFHAGVAQGAGDDLGAAVVPVEAGFGNQYANFLCAIGFFRNLAQGRGESTEVTRTGV